MIRIASKLVILLMVLAPCVFSIGCEQKKPYTGKEKVQKGANNEQTICPVSRMPIDKKYFVDQDGKRIYAASPEAAKAIAGGFKEIAKSMEEDGIVLAKP